jgi:hypothetical protein
MWLLNYKKEKKVSHTSHIPRPASGYYSYNAFPPLEKVLLDSATPKVALAWEDSLVDVARGGSLLRASIGPSTSTNHQGTHQELYRAMSHLSTRTFSAFLG